MKSIYFLIILVAVLSAHGVSATTYNGYNCQQLAKEYQAIHDGSLIWVQPLTKDGAWDLGPYKAHVLNKAWSKEIGNYYYDPSMNSYYKSKEAIIKDMETLQMKQKVVVFDLSEQHPPFALRWYS